MHVKWAVNAISVDQKIHTAMVLKRNITAVTGLFSNRNYYDLSNRSDELR